MKEVFEVYVEAYAKVKSGKVLDHQDFGYDLDTEWVEYDERQKVAVALGAEDVDNELDEMRSKSEVIKKIDSRLS